MTKNENNSHSFLRKMVENIKQTKDAQAPDDPKANEVGALQRFAVSYAPKCFVSHEVFATILFLKLFCFCVFSRALSRSCCQ